MPETGADEAVQLANSTLASLNKYYQDVSSVNPITPIPAEFETGADSDHEAEVLLDHIDRIRNEVGERHGRARADMEETRLRRNANRLAETKLPRRLDQLEDAIPVSA